MTLQFSTAAKAFNNSVSVVISRQAICVAAMFESDTIAVFYSQRSHKGISPTRSVILVSNCIDKNVWFFLTDQSPVVVPM
jgi:hypothetical protein